MIFQVPTLPMGRHPSLCKVATRQPPFKSIIMQDFCCIQCGGEICATFGLDTCGHQKCTPTMVA